MNPQFPVYIPTKGRFNSLITIKHLERIGVPYHAIVEEQEYDSYAAVVNQDNLLVLNNEYKAVYDSQDPAGDHEQLSKGPGPARNFAWDHAIASKASWHWVMDDNISGFVRLVRNQKHRVTDGTIFRCMEDFVLRYDNVALAGPNYRFFAKHRQPIPPFILNTRIFSCILIRNDLSFRWRGRYNEDLDLSLRALKAKWCTVQFNAFLQNKIRTQMIKGGNTADFYEQLGTLPKSKIIVKLHPDVARLVWRFGRWHHHVDYRPFKKTKLIPRDGLDLSHDTNEYGMSIGVAS